MRHRILRLTATAGATALLATAGLAAAATASASTTPATRHSEMCVVPGPMLPPGHPMVVWCHEDGGLLDTVLDLVLGEDH
jgi:hypothetical protein